MVVADVSELPLMETNLTSLVDRDVTSNAKTEARRGEHGDTRTRDADGDATGYGCSLPAYPPPTCRRPIQPSCQHSLTLFADGHVPRDLIEQIFCGWLGIRFELIRNIIFVTILIVRLLPML